jgi:hypothetical protein
MKKKIQVTVDLDMLAWFKAQAELYGVSVSGLVNISMAEYRMQKETIGNMPQMMDLINFAMEQSKAEKIEGANDEER